MKVVYQIEHGNPKENRMIVAIPIQTHAEALANLTKTIEDLLDCFSMADRRMVLLALSNELDDQLHVTEDEFREALANLDTKDDECNDESCGCDEKAEREDDLVAKGGNI